MTPTEHVLQAYLRLIRRCSGAQCASLYLPAPASSSSGPLLLHDGSLPGVPELAEPSAAEQFRKKVEDGPKQATAASGSAGASPVPSREPAACLFPVPTLTSLISLAALPPGKVEKRRRRADSDADGSTAGSGAWLGIRMGESGQLPLGLEEAGQLPATPSEEDDPAEWWRWVLALGGALAWHTQSLSDELRDPVSGLPTRTEFQAFLRQALHLPKAGRVSLIFLNPDEFALVNDRFGRSEGDRAIREIASELRESLRASDFVSRYGAAVFAILLPDTSLTQAEALARKLHRHLTEASYLDDRLRLAFSFGVVDCAPGSGEYSDDVGEELVRRGDQALNAAKLQGGGRIAAWGPDSELEEVGQRDRLRGIFTANPSDDYRNMLLLWDTVSIIASGGEPETLARNVLQRLNDSFRPARLAYLESEGNGAYRLVCGQERVPALDGEVRTLQEMPLDAGRRKLLQEAETAPRVAELPLDGDAGGTRRCCAIPLRVADRGFGWIYLDGPLDSFRPQSSELAFLQALCGQLALALDRARLEENERQHLQRERATLRAELQELRDALQQAKLIHRAPAMDRLLQTARRVAATDATILINGESGTGKELLARTVHQLSPRRDKPLIIVDCGAMATSLIDSELFGHERGSYTGADRKVAGRLLEADGGTVLLDEIGELPLEVQSKLLRFAQEKQLTPVGGNRVRKVDVRILAATNRDLAAEVAAGRFRQDLFFRLNVIRLTIPPLRDRPEDVAHLARHFVQHYAAEHRKPVRGLSPEAEELLLRHDWPGNVRELQNRMMQAVVLSDGEIVGATELGLEEASAPSVPPRETASSPGDTAWAGTPAPPAEAASAPSGAAPWDALRQELGRRIDRILAEEVARPLPFGRWIQEDLTLVAQQVGDGSGTQGAEILGIPETTYRRRLRQVRADMESGLSPRSPSWDEVRQRLLVLVKAHGRSGQDLPSRARQVLLEEVLSRAPSDVRLGSGVLGVTQPTFRRWAAELARPATMS